MTTPLGYRTAFTYGAGNDILEERDSLGRVTKYEYDILHNLVRVTDPEGGVTSYEYDVRNNRTAATNGLGNTFTFSYDKVDRMTTVADPEEKAASILYDAEGHVKSVTAPGERTTGYAYDDNYNLLSVTDPKGYVYRYAYDRDGRLTSTTDPLGQTTGYTYDGANRILTQTDKMGLTETYTYDAHGNVLSHTATDGLVTTYAYDLLDRMTSLTDPMGSTAYYTWDVMGNLTGVTDYLGRGTAYTYDLENNLTSVTDAAGRKETMEYDEASRLVSYTSNGGNTVSYDYNKLNALVEKSYADAEGKESADPVEYDYDALGERTSMEDSTGDTLYTYDALGRLTSVTTYRTQETGNDGDSAGTGYSHGEGRGDTVGYTYDGADNLSAVIYPDGTKVIYEYDLNDNLVKVTGRRGETTSYEYDALNRSVAVHLPDGISTYKTYNARNQVTEQTTKCDDCDWILGHYLYTYDDRGYLIAESTQEARKMDPYGRQPHTPYKPEKQGKDCDHGKNKTLSYYLLEMECSYTYDDAGKLLYATETQKGCGTTSWRYAYDLMGNRILEEKKNPGGKVEESNRYVYNESNQLTEAVLCNGRTTRKVCYTYDGDGNLIKEYSPTDNGLTTYQYTVEDRLEAVYTGNAYNRTLQMAVAYDGDGNRVYQVNYNPEKDEDFSCYYGSYNNCDYNGTGIQLRVTGEVSPTEEELIKLIAPAGAVLTSKYELIEYINDVNREYAEVLVEQNINGRTDTTYAYGVDRISRELFNQTSRTAYYLYDPRGSVAGLADGEGHLTKTYRYSVTGELTYGSAAYENEYTYNGESYNPNIHSQYLRARYYCVVTANFLTEDSYLGNINEPLTLNRYNYCISSYLNYVDPSGNAPILPVLGPILPPFPVPSENTDTKINTWDLIQLAGSAAWSQVRPTAQTIISFDKGVAGSLVKALLDKPLVSLMRAATVGEHLRNVFRGQTLLDPMQDKSQTLGNEWSPTRALKDRMSRNEAKVQALAGNVENVNAYYIGRCTGDVVVYAAGLLEVLGGIFTAGSGGSALVAEAASAIGLAAAPVTIIAIAGGAAIAIDGGAMALHGVDMIREDMGRYQESKKKEADEKGGKVPQLKWGNPKSVPTYGHTFSEHGQKVTAQQLIDRANGFKNPHQVGQWLNNQQAAEFLAKVAKGREGTFHIKLPTDIKVRAFLPDGTEIVPDMAIIVMKPDGSIRTAYPYSSLYPTN